MEFINLNYKDYIFRKIRENIPYFIFLLNLFLFCLIFLTRIKFGKYGSIERAVFSLGGVTIILSLLSLYFLAFKNINKFSFKLIIIGYFIFSLILIFTPVLLSTDLYIYIMRGKVFSFYGQNPYLVPVKDFPGDPFLKFTDPAWRSFVQNYGPLWTSVSILLNWIGKNSLDLTLFIYKFYGFLVNTFVLFLIYKISAIYCPGKIKEVILLYAWNPFLLIEFVNNAHNDVLMIFFGVLALYFYYLKKDKFLILCLVLAGLVKYIYWILIPLFLILLFRKGRLNFKLLSVTSLISLFIIVVFYLPFWKDFNIFSGIIDQSGFYNRPVHHYSPLLFLGLLIFGKTIIEFPNLFTVLFKPLFYLIRSIFVIFYFKNLVSKKNIINKIIIALILFALFATATLLPWYFTWWFPFLILKNDVRSLMFWSSVGFGTYVFLYSTSLSLFLVGGFLILTFYRLSLARLFDSSRS